MKLRDKIIWITGASSGIGEALAVACSKEGASVILSSRNEEQLDRVRRACHDPERHMVLGLDLEDSASMEAKAEAVLDRFGRIDILVNNGGVSQRGLLAKTPLEVDRRIMEINYFGQVALTKAVLPHMISQGGGQFVVTSSLVGLVSTPERSTYSASKHALHGFFESLRAEHHKDGIKVLIVCPGFINTNITLNAFTEDGSPKGKMASLQANGMSAADCAQAYIKAMIGNKKLVLVGKREKLIVYVAKFAPSIYHYLIRNVQTT